MKITDEKLAIILKVIELNDLNTLSQIHELLANKSAVPLSTSEKKNIRIVLKDLEDGKIASRGGLFPDYLWWIEFFHSSPEFYTSSIPSPPSYSQSLMIELRKM